MPTAVKDLFIKVLFILVQRDFVMRILTIVALIDMPTTSIRTFVSTIIVRNMVRIILVYDVLPIVLSFVVNR